MIHKVRYIYAVFALLIPRERYSTYKRIYATRDKTEWKRKVLIELKMLVMVLSAYFWVAEWLLASQEDFCSVELILVDWLL